MRCGWRAEEHLPLPRLVVADDDGLAAAEIEAGDGGLVRHAARETERVDDGFVVGRVVPEARAAERGAERGVVDRDDAAVSGAFVGADDELFVAEF